VGRKPSTINPQMVAEIAQLLNLWSASREVEICGRRLNPRQLAAYLIDRILCSDSALRVQSPLNALQSPEDPS
jgi:hypothetical protein